MEMVFSVPDKEIKAGNGHLRKNQGGKWAFGKENIKKGEREKNGHFFDEKGRECF